jgi:hypothetical protein
MPFLASVKISGICCRQPRTSPIVQTSCPIRCGWRFADDGGDDLDADTD